MTDRDPFRAVSRDDGDDDRTLLWDPGPRVQPAPPPVAAKPPRKKRGIGFRIARYALIAFAGYYLFCVVLLVAYRFVNPPTTGVQMQRRVESWFSSDEYQKRRSFVALKDLPRHVPRAVIAAEDGRFREHHGYDWEEMTRATGEARSGTRFRGASTLTQQLVKNLFGCACRNPIRKVYDLTLTPAAELILGKDRILELYLNQVEWGRGGVFGIDAGAREHYDRGARRLTRTQAAGMAALLPNPRQRTPRNTPQYRADILRRMSHRGW
ncbi:monofunctional biosynthetic peptidoglycan transglycosylase [Longimicrobium terrae]|uniref:Monofunctional biosynthetic peptidoglycan transglycosylase n=1 Tax=Longimicrobium terrae TaxID=1639882 RepID=A0A841H3X5_9BACT|nr:monofunctional biosynthetic peptidoglycan transglycosylase [Longimicrobium terrae]MBB4638541.1 monofunctional biosynthetic peptidoglycan transglycosylase [Longimicrobium terrae]MBB6072821.1 monofunctional biosynthetic peptidoglycan transglycosylase [Longimicrobium terrae]NNC30562.1 monofunctional biosynthetic peptidoglycan transglycosylase [Longimicrobium terrae]